GFRYNSYQGRSYIFYGGSLGIGITSAASANRIITGETGTTRFGRGNTLCDFNGDGYADLAVSATAFGTDQGRAYVFHGGTTGITATDAASANRIITGTSPENFSSPLNCGDVNNDGYADLLAGAIGYGANVGRAYLFYGSSSGITATTAGGANATFTGEAANGQLSLAITLGDYDGDSHTDIVLGAPAAVTNSGRAYAVYGSATPFSGNTTVVHTANTIIQGGTNDNMGGAFATGDFNGDGATDLAMGGYGTASIQSRMHVFYGSIGVQNLKNNSGPIQTTVTETNIGYFLTTSIVSGDLNADGKDELCVGAHGGTLANGYVAVFFGSSSLLTATAPSHAGYSRSGSGLVAAGEQFGRAVGIIDVNGDGYGDLLVGANLVAPSNTGKVFIFHGSASGPAATPNTTITGDSGTEFGISFGR
ncbi:MAG: FG-GAP-like repeat-containing protein, partial [Leptospiraceae bacterium]|nr:FG-GAP-like repeat-containing protein [Leptospiraceae bacterium]